VNQRPTSVLLTRSLRTACRSSYAAYGARLENEKLQAEKKKTKKAAGEQAIQEQKRLQEVCEAKMK